MLGGPALLRVHRHQGRPPRQLPCEPVRGRTRTNGAISTLVRSSVTDATDVTDVKEFDVEERPAVVVASASDGVRAQLRLTLGDERFDVREASDARGAATEVASHRPILVVLDAELPGGGAGSFAAALRGQPETADVRILVLSPRDGTADDLPDAVDATIGLPATSFALLRRIEELLEGA